LVDFTKSAVPDPAAAKVRVAVEANRAQLETLGYNDGESAQMSQIGLPKSSPRQTLIMRLGSPDLNV